MLMKVSRALLAFLLLALGAAALAQTTVTLQQGLNGYAGTEDTRLVNSGAQEGASAEAALIAETSTSLAIGFKIFQAEGGPVPNGATIHSATLSLYKHWGPGSSFKASRFLKSWSETGATWNATGTSASWSSAGALTAGGDYSAAADGQSDVVSGVTWLNINVTTGVQAFAGGFPNNGWKVADTTGASGEPRYFRTRDYGTADLRPKLTITYSAAPQSGCNGGALRPYEGAPVNGSPIPVSGTATFEAEHFNCGGEGVAYHDNVAGNAGNAGFRTDESVDISASAAGNVVNNFENGEWLTYTINVAQAGVYDLSILAANNYAPGAFRIEIDGANVTGSVPVGMTGSWDSFQWFTRAGVSLAAGTHVLKLVTEQQYFNVNQLRVAFVSAPPASCGAGELRPYDGAPVNGNPIPVPASGATFEAEHFNCGGEGVAYRDNVTGNAGNAGLRTGENVDISNSAEGPVVNNFETSEWLKYSINVAQAGSYTLAIRASNNLSPASFRLEVDGVSAGSVAVPLTGGWDTFQWFTTPAINLAAGQHVVRLYSEQQYFNVNQLRISPAGGGGGGPNPPSLLFRSGFDGGTTLQTPSECYNNGCWQLPAGTDSTTGFSWPFSYLGGSTRFQLIADAPNPAGGDHTPTSIGQYMFDQIRAGEGRNGSSALYQQISQSGCCGTNPQGGGATQNVFHLLGSNPTDFYISYWMKLQPDLLQKMGGGGWRNIFEIKTQQPVDFRYIVQVRVSGGTPFFYIHADSSVPVDTLLWNKNVPAAQAPVPIGEWFKFEVFWHRSSGSDGRFWAAVNGVVLDDHSGPNIGVQNLPMDRIMITNLYSSSSYPISQWVDDLQIWSTFPSAVPGDAWYDPPYAPH